MIAGLTSAALSAKSFTESEMGPGDFERAGRRLSVYGQSRGEVAFPALIGSRQSLTAREQCSGELCSSPVYCTPHDLHRRLSRPRRSRADERLDQFRCPLQVTQLEQAEVGRDVPAPLERRDGCLRSAGSQLQEAQGAVA